LGQRTLLIRPNPRLVEPAYLNYLLNGPDVQELIHAKTNGATVPHLNMKDVRSLPLPELPSLAAQQLVAGTLSAYDELIENSQRRIKILESMARALYQEWFVHFRFPGHDNCPLVASPFGEVPQGWEIGRLDDVLVLQRGFDLPKASRTEGTVPIIAANGITGFHNEAKVKAPGVVTGRSGTIGEVFYIQKDFWPLNTSLWVKEFPRSEPLYAYYVLSSLDLKQFNSGAAVPTLNRNDIHGMRVVVPPRDLQKRFQEIAEAMLAQSRTLDLQNQNLRRTRDLLLPRLLSGQIEVEAA
jgi:type I restriction enzyme S subunit